MRNNCNLPRIAANVAATLLWAAALSHAQTWDLPAHLGDTVSKQTEGMVRLSFEQRGRYETRSGQNFGKDPDLSVGLIRTRLGVRVKPAPWIVFSAMAQDSRAPWYGPKAPNTMRDQVDLHESYFELFPDRKKGFGMMGGRKMLNYGDTRLIGSPQWSNLSRTFDMARLYYRSPRAQWEFLVVSPVKVRIGEFNHPVLGDRVWGTYDSFSGAFHKSLAEVYYLRHDQNRPGGFTGGKTADGTDRLGVNTFGARLSGPLGPGLKYTVEGALQSGKVGPARHRAAAWVSTLTRRWTIDKRALDLSAEYKFASGTANPKDTTRESTFDQLYPANHDKFGHEDLFGWRNVHNLRGQATFAATKTLSVNGLYDDIWLAQLKDALYNGQGKAVCSSATGSAGRHVGREADVFLTWKHKHLIFGAGYGHLFAGEFIRKTTPGVSPDYAYIFHGYSF
ncbi:MAG: hypothetical protein C5B51_29810 [Terriglobia bacterium]|nr:MAG: hypothetical protein C5B51_29810 [Terriglobia bacterium]